MANRYCNLNPPAKIKDDYHKISQGFDQVEIEMDQAQADVSTLQTGKQDKITGAATSITTANLTANRTLVSDASGKVAASSVTNVELSRLLGVTSDIQAQLNARQQTSQKGQPNGYAGLDSTGKVPSAQLPDWLVGQLKYNGSWDAATNTPTLPAPSGTTGQYYIVSVAGVYSGVSYDVGDWTISSGVAWEKIDNSDAVVSFNGRIGAILPAINDYTWGQINKAVSSLADLTTRSAADLNTGILPDARMPDLTGDVTTPEGSVVTTIAPNAVTGPKIAPNAVGTGNIASEAVTGPKIAPNAVGTGNIANGAVTGPKLAPNAVGTSNIADGAVTAPKIADGQLTATKFVPGALTNNTENGLRITALEEQLVENQTLPVPLTHGTNLITTQRSSPLEMVVNGRTLVNIPGSLGNGESLAGWTATGTFELSSTRKMSGISSFKGVSAGANSTLTTDILYLLDTSKAYLLAGWVYIESYAAGTAYIGIEDIGGGTIRYQAHANVATIGSWQLVYVKIPTGNTLVGSGFRLRCILGSTATSTVYFDDIRIYEVTATEYAAIGSTITATTVPSIDDVWPYVDGVKHLSGIGAIKPGLNLLPPATQAITANAAWSIVSPYKMTFNRTSAGQDFSVGGPVAGGKQYTLSYSGNVVASKRAYRADGTFTTIGSDTIGNVTFTVPVDAVRIVIIFYQNTNGTYSLENWQLELGSVATPFEQRNDDQAYADVTLAKIGDRTDSIDLAQGKKFKAIQADLLLDNSFSWFMNTTQTGFKEIGVTLAGQVVGAALLVKPNGSPMRYLAAAYEADTFNNIGGSTIRIRIPMSESGWGDDWNPTPAEIMAVTVFGWKMNNGTFGTPYNNSGTKTWTRWDAANNTGAVTTIPTTLADGYPGYKYSYALATPTTEDVTVDGGGIALHAGGNIVELFSGVVVRERAYPQVNGLSYAINYSLRPDSYLQNRTDRILAVHRGDQIDNKWITITDANANGRQRLAIAIDNYDATKEYYVTYVALDKYLRTTNIIDAVGRYSTNIASVVGDLVQLTTDQQREIVDLQFAVDYAEGHAINNNMLQTAARLNLSRALSQGGMV